MRQIRNMIINQLMIDVSILHVQLVSNAAVSVSFGRISTLNVPSSTENWDMILVDAKTGPTYFSGRYSWIHLCTGGCISPTPIAYIVDPVTRTPNMRTYYMNTPMQKTIPAMIIALLRPRYINLVPTPPPKTAPRIELAERNVMCS